MLKAIVVYAAAFVAVLAALIIGCPGCALVESHCYTLVTVAPNIGSAVVFNACTGNVELHPLPTPPRPIQPAEGA